MFTKITYFIKYDSDKSAWLSENKLLEEFENISYIEEREILYPENGKLLKEKNNQEEIYFESIWLKNTTIDDYEEVEIENK